MKKILVMNSATSLAPTDFGDRAETRNSTPFREKLDVAFSYRGVSFRFGGKSETFTTGKSVEDIRRYLHFVSTELYEFFPFRLIKKAFINYRERYLASNLLYDFIKEDADYKKTCDFDVSISFHDEGGLFNAIPDVPAIFSYFQREKLKIIADFWYGLSVVNSHQFWRYHQLEMFALALSRCHGSVGDYIKAEYYADATLKLLPNSFSFGLKAAKFALRQKIERKKVPSRLEKFIGKDNDCLSELICDVPFRRFDVVETGAINVCCGHLLPQNVGHLRVGEIEEILNSDIAQSIRKSVTDGSFSYCNVLDCEKLASGALIHKKDLSFHPAIKSAIEKQDFRVSGVDEMLFAYDQSCNLACPSCRKDIIREKASESDEKVSLVEKKIYPLLKDLKRLNLNVAGEVFASKPSRRILEMVSEKSTPHLEIDLITNGTLFTPKEWQKFPGTHGKLDSVRISMDGCTKFTFEKLRRNANFEVQLENLKFIKSLRDSGSIKQLIFSFTYQLDNFKEMVDFVDFALEHSVDRLIFEPLQNIGTFTEEEFSLLAVHQPANPRYHEFINVITSSVFTSPPQRMILQSDFSNYPEYQLKRIFDDDGITLTSEAQFNSVGLTSQRVNGVLSFREDKKVSRHYISVRERVRSSGLWNFEARWRGQGERTYRIEIINADSQDYARLDFDTVSCVPDLFHESEVLGFLSNCRIKIDQAGRNFVSFDVNCGASSLIQVNIVNIDRDGNLSYPGDPDRLMTAVHLSARPVG